MSDNSPFCHECGEFVGFMFGGEPWPCECRVFVFTAGCREVEVRARSLREAVQKFGEYHATGNLECVVVDSESGKTRRINITAKLVIEYQYKEVE